MPAADANAFRFASALSTDTSTTSAAREAAEQLARDLGGPADLLWLFVSPPHAEQISAAAQTVTDLTGARVLLGCTGESIIGGPREIEDAPALALWGARLPGVNLLPFRLEYQRSAEGGSFRGWPADLPEVWPPSASLLLLADPFSFPADVLLARLNDDQPGIPIIGGMASGGWQPGQNRLVWNRQTFVDGALALWIDGPLRVRSVVSQGCRPIGRHFVITEADRNLILKLSGQSPLHQLRELFPQLTPREQALVSEGLHLGRVTNEYQEQFRRGDFLIRNVMGADPNSGTIAIGDFLRPGQTVQFHVRDGETADEDLREMLTAAPPPPNTPVGALLFSCNGRGTRLFKEPHHDAAAIHKAWGPLPLAGFFAQGEIGPVGRQNFLHGFTASVALFEPTPS